MPNLKPKKMGRPRLPKGEAKSRIVPVRFSALDLRRIAAKARASHQTVSECIRRIVTAALGTEG